MCETFICVLFAVAVPLLLGRQIGKEIEEKESRAIVDELDGQCNVVMRSGERCTMRICSTADDGDESRLAGRNKDTGKGKCWLHRFGMKAAEPVGFQGLNDYR